MSVGRREFIIGSVSVAASSQLLSCGDDSGDKGPPGPDGGTDGGTPGDQVNTALFAHGVASGDPLADAVILWTRVTVVDGANVELSWQVSKDPLLTSPVKSGSITASADADFTAKVDVTGLEAGTTYYYAFSAAGRGRSVTGRTRTLPTQLDHARIAFTSCANYQNGYFAAYHALATRNDLDVWIHLGDYIYEYKAGEYADAALAQTRSHLPAKEAVTLADYRGRYAQYRADPDLLALHRQHPLIAVWDDHEFANNAYIGGAENHNPDQGEGDWTERKRAASRAFREWLPIRVLDADPVPKIFRSFKFGDLFDLIMLDTRIFARDKQTGNDTTFGDVGDPAAWGDPARHIVGNEQKAWLLNELTQSATRGARWRLIGNQVIFSQGRNPLDSMDPHGIIYSDFWDGYQADRNGVIDGILQGGIKNVVFLTGDIHSSWAFEISKNPFDPAVYDPAAGRNGFAVELVGPSVTSLALENDPGNAMAAPILLPQVNPHLRFSEFTRKGYVLVDLTNDRLQAEWWYVMQYKAPNDATEVLGKAFTCQQSAARLVETSAPTPPKAAPPLIA